MTPEVDADDVADWIRARRARAGERRYLFGVAGPPGSGKSTLAERFAVELDAVVAPMDGFHLPNRILDERGLRGVKGAPQTFDADGFVAAVRALRDGTGPVAWPLFDRAADEPIVAAHPIAVDADVVVIEGNYLLLDREPWSELPTLLDDIAYVAVDDEVRVERLVRRHVAFGRDRADAEAFVRSSDELNAAVVAASRTRADLVIRAS